MAIAMETAMVMETLMVSATITTPTLMPMTAHQ
jgi:hypothetical protein